METASELVPISFNLINLHGLGTTRMFLNIAVGGTLRRLLFADDDWS